MQGSYFKDCCTILWCFCCTLCQESMVNHDGYNCNNNGPCYVQRSYENLENSRNKKIKVYKARFEPIAFCLARNSPNHYTAAIVTAANH